MHWKLTCTLICLNLAAFSCLYWLQQRDLILGRENAKSSLRLPLGGEIKTLKLTFNKAKGQQRYELKKDSKHQWRITHPIQWPANKNIVEHLLAQIRFSKPIARIELKDLDKADEKLEDFGLKNPLIELELTTAKQTSQRLLIGAPTQMGGQLYLMSEDSGAIFVVSRKILKAVDISLQQLYQNTIFNIPSFEIETISVQTSESQINLKRQDQQWKFETPILAPANRERVIAMLDELQAQKITNVLTSEQAEPSITQLNTPWMRIILKGNKRSQTLLIGAIVKTKTNEVQQRYATLEGSSNATAAFTLPVAFLEKLIRSPETLREKQFLRFENINTIQIQSQSKTLRLQKLEKRTAKDPETWQCIRSATGKNITSKVASTPHIHSLLKAIEGLRAIRFVSDSPAPSELKLWGLEQPQRSLELRSPTQQSTLLIGKSIPENPRELYAKLKNANTVYAIDLKLLTKLRTNPLAFQSRQLGPLSPKARILELRIEDLQNKKTILSYEVGKPYSLENHKAKAIEELKKTLKDFRVKDYLYDKFEVPENLKWRWKLTAKIQIPNNSKKLEKTYLFSERKGIHQVGGSPENNTTFTLTPELVKTLGALTLKEPSLSPEEIRQKATIPKPESKEK